MTYDTDRLGKKPIPQLLATLSITPMLSTIAAAVYNTADSLFMARIGEDALTAFSLSAPFQILLTSCTAESIACGISPLTARILGQKKNRKAGNAVLNGLLLSSAAGIFFTIIFLFFSGPICGLLDTDGTIRSMTAGYLRIYGGLIFPVFIVNGLEQTLLGCGKAKYYTILHTTVSVLSVLLDIVLIFGICGSPALGLNGAVIAFTISNFIGMLLGAWLVFRRCSELEFDLQHFSPDFGLMRSILKTSLPLLGMGITNSISNLIMNNILLSYSPLAVSIYAVFSRLKNFSNLPASAIQNAVITILSYNFGARKKQRIRETIRLSIIIIMMIMMTAFIIEMFFPKEMLGIFNASKEMLEMGIPAFRILALGNILGGWSYVCSGINLAFDRAHYSFIIASVRQCILYIGFALLFGKFFGLAGVWAAYSIGDGLSFLGYVLGQTHIEKTLIDPMETCIEEKGL